MRNTYEWEQLDERCSDLDDAYVSETSVGDSDADPDYVLPEEGREYSESDDDDKLLDKGTNNIVNKEHINILPKEDYIIGEDQEDVPGFFTVSQNIKKLVQV